MSFPKKIIFTVVALLITTVSFQARAQTNTIINSPAYSGNKNPNILFDEAHHNFHTSTGRYKPFADVLANEGYLITPNKQKITPKVLTGYDVFVCSNAFSAEPDSVGRLSPLPAFTAEECHYLKQWVLNGGSVWLIADHEPAGNAVANLSDSFGVNMSKSYTADPKNFDKIVLDASWIHYSVENKNLGTHPIIKGRNEAERIKNALSFTGQSLKGPKGSVPFLLLSDEAYDVLNIEDRLKAKIISAKGRCQALAMKFGKGRIVICGEAAMFTSQNGDPGMNFPGTDNKQLLLNIAHWLTRLI
ncbi:MAG: hypothetical protein ABIO81_00955 [Ginsengibacter sp.]